MRIHLIAVGRRMPDWVGHGFHEYARRMPLECRLQLVELAAVRRHKTAPTGPSVAEEGRRMLAALPRDSRVITLDVRGRQWSTEELAQELSSWLKQGRDVALMVGGADGLAPAVRERADTSWALSRLTLPHMLVRIVVAEQLYRASTIIRGHPYHR